MQDTLAYQIMAIRNDIVAYCSEQLQRVSLTQGQLFFLVYVAKHDKCTPGELAKALHMDNGHATRTITKLIAQGFMKQYPHAVDKRSHILRLTAQGRDAFVFAQSLFQTYDEEMLHGIDAQEKAVLKKLVQNIQRKKALENETGNYI